MVAVAAAPCIVNQAGRRGGGVIAPIGAAFSAVFFAGPLAIIKLPGRR